jgi:hypothetical protein
MPPAFRTYFRMGGTQFGDDFSLTLLTSDPRLAAEGDTAGVNRIGVDLERLGKAERQPGLASRISDHTWDDLTKIAPSVRRADLFARINPIHEATEFEIENALRLGVKVLMLPAFETAAEVSMFTRTVRGRARAVILVETSAAASRIREILYVPGVDEVMIGLNDLHQQLGISNHFELLASPAIDTLASEVRRRGLPLSIGGLARVNDSTLPVPPDLIYAQYPRLGATGAWIARSFLTALPADQTMGQHIRKVRKRLSEWASESPEALERAREELANHAARWKKEAPARAKAHSVRSV